MRSKHGLIRIVLIVAGSLVALIAVLLFVVLPHATNQYLAERTELKEGWLETLEASEIPTTIIWGLAAPGWYWQLENPNHYLQNDQRQTIGLIVRAALGEEVRAALGKEGDVTHIPAPATSRIALGTGADR